MNIILKLRENIIMKKWLFIITGTLLMAVAYKTIYDSVGMITGGFSGISIIVRRLSVYLQHYTMEKAKYTSNSIMYIISRVIPEDGIPIWITNISLNIPLFICAYKERGIYFLKDTLAADVQYEQKEIEHRDCKRQLDELLQKHGYVHDGHIFRVERSNHDKIVLFCHFGVECVILSHLIEMSPMLLWHNFVALPTSVTTAITEEREEGIAVFRINAFGDTSHLYAGAQPISFAARFCECYRDDTRH